jgi:iron-sulfur cluster assembly protein
MSIEVTENAARRIRHQLAERGHGLGLRLGIKTTGCSGYAYLIDYADESRSDDVVVEAHGVKVLVAEKDLPLLQGLRMDFRREGLNEVFRFDNPNAAALCGCGESFSPAPAVGAA